ncbi:hypothetical protein Goshw_011421 [Gossypium schwendimanii]|uniref:Metal-nicotianamine transporter YSL6 n=1 Tax=Gossypium schwendimanii TaxID=34291 RepID=A0A7J9MHA9_GOSSC|nr:hypothetical protein [Gossypium schwendimanii]
MGTEISEPLILDKESIDDGAGIESELVPEWKDQITIRGLVVSALLGTLFCIITHKLNLTVGIIPSLNVGAGLLGFFFVKSWTGFLTKLGFQVSPFTKQENTVIQTCVVACYGLAFSGGFGSYMIAMDERTYKLIGADYPGNRAEDIKNPGLGWMTGFLFVVSFLGLFSLTPLRKSTAQFFLGLSYRGVSSGPSFLHMPVIGTLLAWKAIILKAFMGTRYSEIFYAFASVTVVKSFDGSVRHLLVFIAIALILGDGLYNLIKIIYISAKEMCNKSTKQSKLPIVNEVIDNESSKVLAEQRKRDDIFLKDRIPTWFAASGYVALAAISTATIPIIFPPLKWYLVLVSYIIAPALAFCNSYGTGLTDWNLSSTYGKIGLFIIASLVGSDGGVMAGLAACGVMMSIVSTAADLMQDFKTGYLTLSSAKSMFVSQLLGTAMGCVIAPLTFWMFWTAFEVGSPDGPYKAPYAVIFREMAILGIEGFSELPNHCLALCFGFFIGAVLVNLLRDVTPKEISQFIPIPMAMAVPFYIGAYFAVDMFVGTVILFIWERINQKEAEDYAGAVASGLICGDGIWTIPSAILSILRINPPICMYFGPSLSS